MTCKWAQFRRGESVGGLLIVGIVLEFKCVTKIFFDAVEFYTTKESESSSRRPKWLVVLLQALIGWHFGSVSSEYGSNTIFTSTSRHGSDICNESVPSVPAVKAYVVHAEHTEITFALTLNINDLTFHITLKRYNRFCTSSDWEVNTYMERSPAIHKKIKGQMFYTVGHFSKSIKFDLTFIWMREIFNWCE